MIKRLSVCLAIVFVCSAAIPALAQNAALVGTVRDAQQALIPGVMVTLQNLDTGVELTTMTNELGNYEFPTVRPGNYSVRVELSGFRRFVQNIALAVNQRSRVDGTLQVGDVSAEVSVQEAAVVVQTESSALGDVVHSRDLVNIPLNGRFFLDLALMTAGTVVPSTNTRTFLATPSGIGISGINASGTREDSTNYLFDGINLSDMLQNQITFKPNVFGYSIGGPIGKGKTFFFHSYEGRQGREVTTLNTQVPTAAERAVVTNPVIQKLLALVPAANLGNRFAGTAPRKRGLNQFTGRVDHNFSSRDIFFGNFVSNRVSRTEPTLQQQNLPLPGYGDYRPAERYLLSLGETHIFSPTLTNELRAGANRVHIQFVPDVLGKLNPLDFGLTTGSPVFPNILVSGVMNFGGIEPFPQGRGDTAFQYNDTLSWI